MYCALFSCCRRTIELIDQMTRLEVILPMAKSGLIAGSLFAFIWSFENVTAPIFLAAPGMTPLPITMWGFSESDFSLCAVTTLFIVVAFGVFVAIYRRGERLPRLQCS
jgi:ABC-type spermidine/putrescine transport system permease subunit II